MQNLEARHFPCKKRFRGTAWSTWNPAIVCNANHEHSWLWHTVECYFHLKLKKKKIKWAFSALPLDIPPSCYADRTIVGLWENLGRVQILCLWLWELVSGHFNGPHEERWWCNLWFPIFWHWTLNRRRGLFAFFVLHSTCKSSFWSLQKYQLLFSLFLGDISCFRSCFQNRWSL